jgi:hypothetical protein
MRIISVVVITIFVTNLFRFFIFTEYNNYKETNSKNNIIYEKTGILKLLLINNIYELI